MICRLWRGWTTPENAAAYEAIVRGEVIPEIEARRIPGFLSIDLMRRPTQDGVEFATIMWFDDIGAVKAFAGEDYDVAHVPSAPAPSSRTSTNAQRTTRSQPSGLVSGMAAIVGARVIRPQIQLIETRYSSSALLGDVAKGAAGA